MISHSSFKTPSPIYLYNDFEQLLETKWDISQLLLHFLFSSYWLTIYILIEIIAGDFYFHFKVFACVNA